jgi:hypothetical protein
MNANKRNGNRWTVNEVLSLQREYELLEWNIQRIALKHERTERAILFRLESEGFIASWNDARGFDMESYKASIEDDVVTEDCVCNEGSCLDDEEEDEEEDEDEEDRECCDNDSEYEEEEEDEEEDEEDEDDDVSEVENLSVRVLSLENDVNDIKHMVQQLFDNMVSSNQKKSLRKQMGEDH